MFCSDSGRGSSLLDRTIADRRQLNTITLPDFSDPETGENNRPEGTERCPRARGAWPRVASGVGQRRPGPGLGNVPYAKRLNSVEARFLQVSFQVCVHSGGYAGAWLAQFF